MNVHVRLFAGSALASLAALALVGAPLAAQSAQFGSDAGASAFAAVGVMPTGLAGQLGSVPRDEGARVPSASGASI